MKTTLKLFSLLLLITLFGCEENNYYTAEGLGKVNVYIEGDITNVEAQAQLQAEIGTLTEIIYVSNTTELTAITIHSDHKFRTIAFSNNAKLTNITISGIKELGAISFYNPIDFLHPDTPITINCNDLEETSSLYVGLQGNTGNNLNFNKLKKVGFGGLTLSADCNDLNFPLLENVYNFDFNIIKDVVTFPALKTINKISDPYDIRFSQLNLPALESCKRFDFNGDFRTLGTEADVVVTIPHLNYCEYFVLNYAVHDSNVTNALLHQFLSVLPISGKWIQLGGNSGPATGQGLIDRQTLVNNGNTVLCNY